MRLSGISLVGIVLASTLCPGSAFAHELQRGGNVSCQGPFTSKETGLDVMERYKSAAKIEEISALDGESFNGVVLFPTDSRARLEVEDTTGGDASGHLTAVNLKEKNSQWTIEGLSTGMTPAELTAAIGGPVTLSGIEQLSESTFGLLGWIARGNCTVVVTFYAPEGARFEHPLYQKEVKSDDPRLAPLNLKLDVLILQLPPAPDAE